MNLSKEEIEMLQKLIRDDLEKPYEEWSDQDKEDFKACGFKPPKQRKNIEH